MPKSDGDWNRRRFSMDAGIIEPRLVDQADWREYSVEGVDDWQGRLEMLTSDEQPQGRGFSVWGLSGGVRVCCTARTETVCSTS